MKKDVLISIRGLQFQGEDEDEIETIVAGQYQEKNGSHYLIYEEIQEGTEEKTKNILKFNQERLHMSKSGCVNVNMDFEKNRKSFSTYQTPFGNLMLGIDTTEIALQLAEDSLNLSVQYGLEVNYEHMADCHITVSARNRENGISLQ